MYEAFEKKNKDKTTTYFRKIFTKMQKYIAAPKSLAEERESREAETSLLLVNFKLSWCTNTNKAQQYQATNLCKKYLFLISSDKVFYKTNL